MVERKKWEKWRERERKKKCVQLKIQKILTERMMFVRKRLSRTRRHCKNDKMKRKRIKREGGKAKWRGRR